MAAIQRVLVLNQRRRRPRSRLVHVNIFILQNLSPFDILPDMAILQKCRLPRQLIMELLDLLRPALARLTRRNFALSPEVQLLAALRFFATGSFIEVVGEGYGLSKTSVWRCVHTVTNALLRHAGDYIRLPATRQEVQEVHQGCHAIAGIPRVLGLVDGTLIPIADPSVIDQAYISRKGYAAINVQVIVDHRGVISDLVARWPGSTHDSFVWANSAVGEQAEREGFGQSLFLGDSGYPLRTYLFTPLTNPQTRAERAYNVAHVHTRSVVECRGIPGSSTRHNMSCEHITDNLII
uniref:Putative nuclease HARBI1 n=1 Tax=Sinocyclocheilus grahami TaxID=75366 RepID=A0A672LUB4_SINGR